MIKPRLILSDRFTVISRSYFPHASDGTCVMLTPWYPEYVVKRSIAKQRPFACRSNRMFFISSAACWAVGGLGEQLPAMLTVNAASKTNRIAIDRRLVNNNDISYLADLRGVLNRPAAARFNVVRGSAMIAEWKSHTEVVWRQLAKRDADDVVRQPRN